MRNWCSRHPVWFMALYALFYLSFFALLERTIQTPDLWVHCQLDDLIPFCKYAIVPYILWFPWIPFTLFYLLYKAPREDFWRLCIPLFTGMTMTLLFYAIVPNGLALRPKYVPGTDIFAQLVRMIYRSDTPMNVCPSIHVFNSVTLMLAYYRSAIFDAPRRRWMRSAAMVLCVSISLSTILLKQHSVIDVVFGLLLALLLVLRGDLLDRWQQQLPPESPNYFLINIATEQVAPLKAFLAEHQIVPESFYPVVRARLTAINDKPTEGNEDEALNRELNLTWQNTRPDHNPIVAGNWPPKADEVSMEEGLAKRLNVALGDTVTFMGDTQEFRAKVTSLRKVDWESLRPNFYFIFPEGALDGQPQSWLTSFRWENGNGMLTQLNRQFPTISLLDIGAILKQVGQVLEQVSRALEVMVVLVTACGMLLLLAQVQVGMRQRHQELVVWRTLGAGKKLLRTTLWCEFAMLGFVSGLVAAIGAETTLAVLQAKVFDFPWEPDWRLWIVLPCSGALLLSLFGGWLGARLVKGKALFRQFAG